MSWLTIGPVELAALRLSLWVAVVAVALSLPVAVAVAYALARCRFWGHGLLNALVHLPLVSAAGCHRLSFIGGVWP